MHKKEIKRNYSSLTDGIVSGALQLPARNFAGHSLGEDTGCRAQLRGAYEKSVNPPDIRRIARIMWKRILASRFLQWNDCGPTHQFERFRAVYLE
jgi:hypothetical protein